MTNAEQTSSSTIASRILNGVAWKAGSQITLQISRMTVALILARLLAPHDWGLAAMVLVFASFVVVFTDSALGTALIQRRDLHEGDRSTVFWLSAGIGLALMLASIFSAGALARFYGEPAVRPLFAAVSIGFLVTALGSTHMALLVREMSFRTLEIRQIAATLVGATAGITIALLHFGAWAIVSQQLAEAATSTALLWYLTPWHPSFTFSSASLRRLGGFAGNVFGENLLYQAGRNLSSLLIGRFLGAAALGTYALATNVILVPFSRIAAPLQQVFFPAFSQMRDDREQLADVWIRATRLVGLISIPALVGLAVVAPDFVAVVLGHRWDRAVAVIQILAGVGIIQSLQTLTGEVLLALNRASTLLAFTAVWFAATVGAFVLGLHWGILGVATCYAAATVLLEPSRAYAATRALGIGLFRFVAAFSGVAQATTLMGVMVLGTRMALVAAGLPVLPRLLILIPVGAASYGLGCMWRAPEITAELSGAIGRFKRKAPPLVRPAGASL
jgi:O-antigen/teichoic acid export membrane protein